MRFDLTQASHRVLERAAQLRLQRGIAAISSAKLLWALFEEDECRAAQWLQESGLTLELFQAAFGIQTLQSPISAPSFPVGSYGISPGQYPLSTPSSPDLESTQTGNNSPPVGNPYPDPLPPGESEHEQQDESDEPIQDDWQPSEPPKYSLYSKQPNLKSANQSRLQFYLDDQRINIGLLTPELEENLETVARRFVRQEGKQSISIAEGVKQIAFGLPMLILSTEHLLLATVFDTGDVGRWLREGGFDAAELYQRIDALNESRERNEVERPDQPAEQSGHSAPLRSRLPLEDLPPFYRLLDAAANRGREALRVLEDYVRFILNDAELTQQLKTFRHQFQDVLQQFPIESRLAARDTEHDVGTEISAEGEYLRPTVGDLVSANFSRLQESLRSLEEFSKMVDPQIARQFEQLRYRGYTLQKDVALHKSGGPTPASSPAWKIPDEQTEPQ